MKGFIKLPGKVLFFPAVTLPCTHIFFCFDIAHGYTDKRISTDFFVRPTADAKAIRVYAIRLHAKGFSRIFLLRRNKNPSNPCIPCSPLNLWVHGRQPPGIL